MKIIAIILTSLIGAVIVICAAVYTRFDSNRFILREAILDKKQNLSRASLDNESYLVTIYDNNETVIGKYSPKKVSKMPLKQCKQINWLNKAIVAAEDQDFYSHNGISWSGIIRAVIRNIMARGFKEGAGTITQQLARNLFAKPQDFKLTRKIYETYVARLIEQNMSKDEILCLYLNQIYMGEGQQGANEAAQFYFRKNPEELNIGESAMLAGILPAPAMYSPLNNIILSLKKQKAVLRRMREEKYISHIDEKKTFDEFKKQYDISESRAYAPSGTIGLYGSNKNFTYNETPDINEYVRRFISERIPLHTYYIKDKENESKQKNGEIIESTNHNIMVYTTIDLKRQKDATKSVRTFISQKIRNEAIKNFSIETTDTQKEMILNGFNGSFLSIENKTGNILAMVSGFSDSEQGYQNRAFDMRRQPGSTIKPLIYTLALENEIILKPYLVEDKVLNINGYSPRNAYTDYLGTISLQQAIAYSSNVTAIQTLYTLGMSQFLSNLSNIIDVPYSDITNRFPRNLTLGLGSGEVTPLELANIYTSIANLGQKVPNRLITQIKMDNGDILLDNTKGSIEFSKEKVIPIGTISSDKTNYSTSVMSKDACLKMVYLLKKAASIDGGTVNWIYKKINHENLKIQFGGKTGSIQTSLIGEQAVNKSHPIKDAWFAAITPYETNVVWVGHDQGIPFVGSGSSSTGGIWLNYIREIYNDQEMQYFPYQTELDNLKDEFSNDLINIENLQIQEDDITQHTPPSLNKNNIDTKSPIEIEIIE